MDADAFARLCLALPDVREDDRVFETGTRLPFARWNAGAQPGPHVRQLLPTYPATADLPHGPGYFWSRVDGVADAELAALVTTAHSIARAPGATNAPTQLFSPVGRAAFRIGRDRVPPDLHAGGPSVAMAGQEGVVAFRLALWSAHLIAGEIPASDTLRHALAHLDAASAAIQPSFARKDRIADPTLRELARTAIPSRDTSPPVDAAVAAQSAFAALQAGFDAAAVLRATDAVDHVLGTLDPAAQRRYLVELDDRVLAAELEITMRAKGDSPPPALGRVLWRGSDAKGMPAYWMVRDADGTYGLFWKVGKRWRFSRGDRDNVLANVPDEHFAAAVEMSLARDRC